MRFPTFASLILVIFIGALCVLTNGQAMAHPEDDFCGPDAGIDPVLCAQLAELNSGEGNESHPLLDDAGNKLGAIEAARHFLRIGVNHILPGGTDHILFVLALFLGATRFTRLVWHISIFTVAHTVTLGLTAAGVIEPPAYIVEPLIALSIAFVAIENIFMKGHSKWRPVVIFGFGLFHGMGFAGFVREIGLPTDQFWPALIGFNVGVEVGQLSVVLAALLISLLLKRALSAATWSYERAVVMPLSLLIAAIGLYWFVTRSLGL